MFPPTRPRGVSLGDPPSLPAKGDAVPFGIPSTTVPIGVVVPLLPDSPQPPCLARHGPQLLCVPNPKVVVPTRPALRYAPTCLRNCVRSLRRGYRPRSDWGMSVPIRPGLPGLSRMLERVPDHRGRRDSIIGPDCVRLWTTPARPLARRLTPCSVESPAGPAHARMFEGSPGRVNQHSGPRLAMRWRSWLFRHGGEPDLRAAQGAAFKAETAGRCSVVGGRRAAGFGPGKGRGIRSNGMRWGIDTPQGVRYSCVWFKYTCP